MAQTSTSRWATSGWSGVTRRWALMAALVVVSVAGMGVTAWAQGEPAERWGHAGAMAFGPGLFMGSPQRVARGVDRLLDGLHATEAQRTQILQIAQEASTDLRAQHEAGRGLFERHLQVLTAPVVDAAAAEQLRQQMLAHHDQVTHRMLQALLQISQVLTPEQRATLAQRVKDHPRHGHPRPDHPPHDTPPAH